jgi:hypothetical protein
VQDRLQGVVFRLEWRDPHQPVWHYGTGFFISESGLALTAFHNLPTDVLADPEKPFIGHFNGQPCDFYWRPPAERDGGWQRELDVAVLQGPPVAGSVLVPLACFAPGTRKRLRSGHWNGRPVVVEGYPQGDGGRPVLVPGMLLAGTPIQPPPVGGAPDAEALVMADQYPDDGNNVQGISGAPLFDPEERAIIGVQFAAWPERRQLFAAELCHVAARWPDLLQHANRIRPRSNEDLAAKLADELHPKWLVAALMTLITIAVLAIAWWVIFWPPRLPVDTFAAGPVNRVASASETDASPVTQAPQNPPASRTSSVPRQTVSIAGPGQFLVSSRQGGGDAGDAYLPTGTADKISGEYVELGFTIWRLRPAAPGPGVKIFYHPAGGDTEEWVPERVTLDGGLRLGNRARFALEVPWSAYLYIVDRELYAGNKMSPPVLIFPTEKLRGGRNRVEPGRLTEIPGRGDAPPYFVLKSNSRDEYIGERLSIFLLPEPLLELQTSAPDHLQVQELEQKLVRDYEQFDLRTPAWKQWTAVEQQAGEGTKVFTHGDPLPQTLYRIPARAGEPVGLVVQVLTAP